MIDNPPTALFNVTYPDGEPCGNTFAVRQLFRTATVIDSAHRGAGVWLLPADTADGESEVDLSGFGAKMKIRWERRAPR